MYWAGFQRVSVAHPLHSVVGPLRDEQPAHPGGCRGGHLHPQPQRASRERNGPALSEKNYLDVRHQGCPYDHIR